MFTKYLLPIILISIPMLTFAQKIIGNENYTKKTNSIKNQINTIDISSIGTVIIENSDTTFVEVETDENIQSSIKIETKKDKLLISRKGDFETKKCVVIIKVKNLKDINASYVGSLRMDKCKFDSLNLKISNCGDIKFELENKKFDAEISHVGNCIFFGKSLHSKITINSIGNFKGYGYKIENAQYLCKNVGNIEISVIKELELTAHNIASIKLKGNPAIKKIDLQSNIKIVNVED
jgi:hypothetical protein